MHFDVGGSLFLQLIEVSAQNAPAGGAISLTQPTATAQIEASVFQHNRATTGNGGALEVSMGHVTVVNTRFVSNAAQAQGGQGGAVYVGADGAMIMTHVTFRGNSAAAGGAIAVAPPTNPGVTTLVLHNAVWGSDSEPNTAQSGGAIWDAKNFNGIDDNEAPADGEFPNVGH